MRYAGLAIGIVLVGAGALGLITGLRQVLDFPVGNCFGPDCFDIGGALITLPASIFALTIGGIILVASMSAVRRKSPGALGGLGAMTALGVTFDVMGAAFLIVEFTTTSVVDGTFLFTGVTFLAVGGLLTGIDLWLAARRRRAVRLRTAGMRGSATILSVSDSNVTINNDPMINMRLRVNISNHPPYEVDKRQVISRIAIGQFVPGAVLPVLVDPADPKDVMIDEAQQLAPGPTGLSAAAGAAAATGWAGFTPGPEGSSALSPDLMATITEALRHASDQFASGEFGVGSSSVTVGGHTFQIPGGGGQTIVISPNGEVLTGAAAAAAAAGAVGMSELGSPAGQGLPTPAVTAVPAVAHLPSAPSAASNANGRISIESLTDTGTTLGDMRLYSFELTVLPNGGMPYKLSHAALVPTAQVPRLINGASFPAIIDANLPGGIGILWDR